MYAHSTYRDLAALKLRRAAALRQEMVKGLLQRGPAVDAIRKNIREARALAHSAWIVRLRGLA